MTEKNLKRYAAAINENIEEEEKRIKGYFLVTEDDLEYIEKQKSLGGFKRYEVDIYDLYELNKGEDYKIIGELKFNKADREEIKNFLENIYIKKENIKENNGEGKIMINSTNDDLVKKYREFSERLQNEFNELPIFFAFSEEQFKKGMEKFGLKEDETDKICRLSELGGFCKREDMSKVRDLAKKHEKEYIEEIKKDETGENFIYGMMRYVLENHEYQLTGDVNPALESIGIGIKELNKDKRLKNALIKAAKDIRESYGMEEGVKSVKCIKYEECIGSYIINRQLDKEESLNYKEIRRSNGEKIYKFSYKPKKNRTYRRYFLARRNCDKSNIWEITEDVNIKSALNFIKKWDDEYKREKSVKIEEKSEKRGKGR